MNNLNRQRIRLPINTDQFDQALDVRTSASPTLWRGNDVQFELGFFRQGELLDVTNFASITVHVKEPSAAGLLGAPVMTKTIDALALDSTVDAASWEDETKSHALVAFTGEEANVPFDANTVEKTYWLVVGAMTTDEPARLITLGHALLLIREAGFGSSGTPPTNDPNYYTKAQTDVLVAAGARNYYAVTALTGGSEDALDSVATAQKANLLAAVSLAANAEQLCWYRLGPGTEAESVPAIIRPDDFDAVRNAQVWRLLAPLVRGEVDLGPDELRAARVVSFGRVPRNVVTVIDGDSIPVLWAGGLNAASPGYFAAAGTTNTAHGGDTAATVLSAYPAEVHPHAPTDGEEGWYFLHCGSNDLRADATAASVYANLQSLWASARADRFRVVAVTITPRTDFTTPQAVEWVALNALILSNPTLYDYCARLDQLLPEASDTALFSDGVHPTPAGVAKIGAYLAGLAGPRLSDLQTGSLLTVDGANGRLDAKVIAADYVTAWHDLNAAGNLIVTGDATVGTLNTGSLNVAASIAGPLANVLQNSTASGVTRLSLAESDGGDERLNLYYVGSAFGAFGPYFAGGATLESGANAAGGLTLNAQAASAPVRIMTQGTLRATVDEHGISAMNFRRGSGSPEGVVTGSIGDLFLRTDGGAGATLYVKESGAATNTGWVAK